MADTPPTPENLQPVPFAVDAALLRELGERLVGRPYIALAELVKNAYDADATIVELEVGEGILRIADNGHGMTEEEFRQRWMRIGSPHKERAKVSRKLKRPLTGSKGIGRLAAQFLGQDLRLWTRAGRKGVPHVYASVDWHEARTQDLITEATAEVGTLPSDEVVEFPGKARHGTIVEIDRLNQEWTTDDLENLAREVWALQPPFSVAKEGFALKLTTADDLSIQGFDEQLTAYLDVWYARIKGRLVGNPSGGKGRLRATLSFSDGERYELDHEVRPCRVTRADIEVRVYYLRYRQPRGLSVQALRNYFNEWGGVHVYDSGFRLPYYGPDEDWLGIEMDHSHRLSKSALLPESEQVQNGLRFLPTNSRLFGEVRVSTANERRLRAKARPQEILSIQASRDRLVDNGAFDDLVKAVRTTLDWYANREAHRASKRREEAAEVERVSAVTDRLSELVEDLEEELPAERYAALANGVAQLRAAEHKESAEQHRRINLLAALATAGASSLAYEHEIGKQLSRLEQIARKLARRAREDPSLQSFADELKRWLERAREARAIFSPLIDESQREHPRALPARDAIERIVADLGFLLRGVTVEIEISDALLLPPARLAEWNTILQNAFTNATAALRGTPDPRIRISSSVAGKRRALRIQDNGVGINLEESDRLFEPFERGDPNQVGSGTGLGLAIVRMIAETIGVRVAFVEPDADWSTSLRISWMIAN